MFLVVVIIANIIANDLILAKQNFLNSWLTLINYYVMTLQYFMNKHDFLKQLDEEGKYDNRKFF